MNKTIKLRIKFRKYGNLKYIGHLDLQRYFQKAVRRAGIDAAYTSGYSPHQIMSFAFPLGIGMEGNGEYMDLEVLSFDGSEETVRRLNEVGVEGIEVLSVKVLPDTAQNAMASVAAASYTIRFRQGREPAFSWQSPQTLEAFLNQKSILVIKETKKNCLETDIRSGIYLMETDAQGIHLCVDASSAGNIKPSLVVSAYAEFNGCRLEENALMITREETFMNKGTREEPVFVPLDADGYLSGKE